MNAKYAQFSLGCMCMLSGVCCREKEMKQTIAQLNEELEGQKAATQKTVQVGFVTHTDAAHCRRRGTSASVPVPVCRVQWVWGRG